MRTTLGRSRSRTAPLAAAALLALAAAGLLLALPAPARAATTLAVHVSGPSLLGTGLQGTYVVTASGGPAEAPNGTQVGIYSFKASLTAFNASGSLVSPGQGVLTNGSTSISVTAPKSAGSATLFVDVTSSLNGHNESQNVSTSVQIVTPYRLNGTLLVGPSGVSAFALTVTLDGGAVGTISVPTLAPRATFPIAFSYATAGLAPGWHTFSLSVAPEHGLVTFANGATVLSQSFYVPAPPTNDTLWYAAGALAFVLAVFIWLSLVGGRRRRRAKK
jgi:hypothetical protein